MGEYNARLAFVHPPPPLKKIVLSHRFFLDREDDGCDTGYARLTLLPRLHVKPLTSVITAINDCVFHFRLQCKS